MGKFLFKLVIKLMIFSIIILMVGRVLSEKSASMGGDFKATLNHIKNGEYEEAFMNFIGENTEDLDIKNLEQRIIEGQEEREDNALTKRLKEMFLDVEDVVNKFSE